MKQGKIEENTRRKMKQHFFDNFLFKELHCRFVSFDLVLFCLRCSIQKKGERFLIR